MTGIERSSENMPEEQRIVLGSLRGLLETIGSANDAEDHGYYQDARQMRKESCEAILALMAEHAFLEAMFPKLAWELDTQHILGFGWADLCNEMDKIERS